MISTAFITIYRPISRQLIRNFSTQRCKIKNRYLNKLVSDCVTWPLKCKLVFVSNLNTYTRLCAVETENMKKKDNWYDTDDFVDIQKKRKAHWKRMRISLFVMASSFGVCSLYLLYALGSPRVDEAGDVIEDEFTTLPIVVRYFKRMIKELEHFNKVIRQPVSDKLLPDPLTYPYYQPQYTLVLEMSDLLIHADWTYQTGWRFKKRPGVDKFLELVTVPMFELVVFTGEQGASTIPLLDALDPNGFIMHRLTRDSTEFVDGSYVKNLNYLNRDLSKVIVVDWNKNSVKFHQNNTIIIPRWTGQDGDTTLVDLAVFLRAIVTSEIDDVREVMAYYNQYDNPLDTFRENQQKFLEKIEADEEKERKKGTNFASKWSNTYLNKDFQFTRAI